MGQDKGKLLQTERGDIQIGHKKKVFYGKGGEALGDIAGQAGGGSEQHDPAVGVPVSCRGVGADDFKGPFQLK